VVACLPSRCEALSQTSVPQKEKKKKQQKKWAGGKDRVKSSAKEHFPSLGLIISAELRVRVRTLDQK
jgi:hypothetical protein